MKISVNSKVRLNGVGIAGAMLFVGGPLVGGFAYLNSLATAARNLRYGFPVSDMQGISNFALACSVAALIGFVMILIGREYDHQIEIDRGDNP